MYNDWCSKGGMAEGHNGWWMNAREERPLIRHGHVTYVTLRRVTRRSNHNNDTSISRQWLRFSSPLLSSFCDAASLTRFSHRASLPWQPSSLSVHPLYTCLAFVNQLLTTAKRMTKNKSRCMMGATPKFLIMIIRNFPWNDPTHWIHDLGLKPTERSAFTKALT
jgi:hypothetical protein